MNEYYLADDGTIHRRVPGAPPPAARPAARVPTAGRSRIYRNRRALYEVSKARKVCFWVYTVLSALAVGSVAVSVFEEANLGEGGLIEFFEVILPFGLIAGAFLGAILFGCKVAGRLSYNLGAFILSPLCAIGGAIALGMAVCILPSVLTFIWYLFIGVVILGVIFAFLTGGD